MKCSESVYPLASIILVSIVWPSPLRARRYNAIVSIDAMGCQKEIARKIVEGGS